MRALVCKEYGVSDKLVIEELADPVAGEGQLRVSVKAAGINFADVLSIAGKYQVKTPPPFIPGIEAAGVIESLGPDVQGLAIGDAVMVSASNGCFAEKVLVDQVMAIPMLPGLDFVQGASFNISYSTTYHAFKQRAQLKAGETLLVLGAAGSSSISAVELGKAFGARVIAAASNADKLEFARAAGADEVINYSDSPLKDTVKQLTDGKGVDVVYDPVGGELAELATRSLAWLGRHLVIGFAGGDIPNLPANIAMLKEASILGVYWGGWMRQEPQIQLENLGEMAKLIQEGKLAPKVGVQHSLDKFKPAFDAITERRAMGKVVLTMD